MIFAICGCVCRETSQNQSLWEEENPRSSGLLASMAGSLQVAYPLVILFEELAIEQVLVDENLGI
jgi:hypothetical protein